MTKTLKVFISQPMKGLQREDILKTRDHEFIRFCKTYYKDAALKAENGEQVEDIELELLDSFNDTICDNPNVVHDRVFYLGRSVMKLAEADILYITQDALQQNSPGCSCELTIALTYGYPVYTIANDDELVDMNVKLKH